jgi:hypothetical protein
VKSGLPVLVLAAALAGLAGCAHFGPKKPEVPEATLPTWVGRVVMVDTVHRFVLVDAGSGSAPAAGRDVVTLRDKRQTALLRVTAEARPPYIAMDIVEGEPALGDQAALEEGREPPTDAPVAP